MSWDGRDRALAASVVIPVLNEEESIESCLERVLGQTVAEIEVIVADGGSTDGTRELVLAQAAGDHRVRLVDNPRRLQSAGLNEALAASSGPFVIRLDGHSFVKPAYVERCLELLSSSGAAAVGGRMVPLPGGGAIESGIALAMARSWGAGPAKFHHAGPAGDVDTVYLGAYRRAVLDEVGGWAEDVGVNEDYELNNRIRGAGHRIHYDPTLEVAYQPRSTFRSLARQYTRYGRSKATMLRRHPESLRARQAVPAGLAPFGVMALTGGRPGRASRLAVGAHLLGVTGAACLEVEHPVPERLAAAAAAVTMHWSWSVGFWYGVARPFPAAS